jgi:hypothetical protein
LQDAHEFLTTSLNLLSEELYAHLKKDEKKDEKLDTNAKTEAPTKNGLTDKPSTHLNHTTSSTTSTSTTTHPTPIDLTDSQPASGLLTSDSDDDCNFRDNCNFSTAKTNEDSNETNTTSVQSNGTNQNGTHETNGINRTNGIHETNGTNGISGTNETNETNGTSGTNGTNETNGTNGTNGTTEHTDTDTDTTTKKHNVISPSKLKCLLADTEFRTTYCPTSRNFDCEVEAKYTCKKCGTSSKVKELYRDLSLDIPRGSELEMYENSAFLLLSPYHYSYFL